MRSSCRFAFEKANRHGVVVAGARASPRGKNKIKEATHYSHCIQAAAVEGGARILFCSLHGAYGARRAVSLKERYHAQDKAKRLAPWSTIMVKQVHPVSKAKLTRIRRARVIGQPPAVAQWAAMERP